MAGKVSIPYSSASSLSSILCSIVFKNFNTTLVCQITFGLFWGLGVTLGCYGSLMLLLCTFWLSELKAYYKDWVNTESIPFGVISGALSELWQKQLRKDDIKGILEDVLIQYSYLSSFMGNSFSFASSSMCSIISMNLHWLCWFWATVVRLRCWAEWKRNKWRIMTKGASGGAK